MSTQPLKSEPDEKPASKQPQDLSTSIQKAALRTMDYEVPRTMKLVQLDETNYHQWAIEMEGYLHSRRLWKYVSGTAKKPSDNASEDDKEDWEVNNWKAWTEIIATCPITFQKQLKKESPKELWDRLQKRNKPKGTAYFSAKLRSFINYKQASDESVDMVYLNLDHLRAEINALPSDDNDKVAISQRVFRQIFLDALKADIYGTVVFQITNKLTKPTMDDILAIVKERELTEKLNNSTSRNPISPETVQANVARVNPKTNKERGEKGPDKNATCSHCHYTGHSINECFVLKSKDGVDLPPNGVKPPPRRMSSKASARQAAEIDTTPPYYSDADLPTIRSTALTAMAREALVGVDLSSINWIVDSGASHHMTSDPSLFMDLRPYDTDVCIANGMTIKATGIGNAQVRVGEGELMFRDTLYVPELDVNLLSIGAASNQGITVEFKHDTVTFQKDKLLVATAQQFGSIYALMTEGRTTLKTKAEAYPTIQGRSPTLEQTPEIVGAAPQPTIVETANSLHQRGPSPNANSKTYDKWHRRFGHAGSICMQRLNNCVKGIGPRLTPINEPCSACLHSKMIRVQSKAAPARAKRVLQRIYSDFWGPYRVTTIGGNRYFVTFTNEHTRHSSLYLLKQKSDLYEVFKTFKQQAKRDTTRKVEIIRSDNGEEYKKLARLYPEIEFEFTKISAHTVFVEHEKGGQLLASPDNYTTGWVESTNPDEVAIEDIVGALSDDASTLIGDRRVLNETADNPTGDTEVIYDSITLAPRTPAPTVHAPTVQTPVVQASTVPVSTVNSATSKPVKLASEEQLPELRESIIALGHQFHWFVISGIPNAKILKETDHLCIEIIYQYYSYDPPSEPTGRSRSSRRNYREGSVIPISSTGSSVVETLGPKFPTVWSIDRTKGSPLHTVLNHFRTGTTLLKETPHFLNYHKVPALSIPQTSPETDAPTTEPSQSSTASPLEKEPRPVTDSTSVETHQLIVNLPTKEASALEEAICLAGIEEENLEEERETTRDGKQRATSHNRLSTEEVSGSHTIEERKLLIQEASLAQEKADIEVRLLQKARDKYDRKEFARGLSGKRNQLAVERNLEKEQRLLERQRLEQADVKQDRLEQERLDQRAEGSLQEQPHFNMSNQEGSSNPRSSGLPSSSNHPFSGNAFSAEQIRVLSQLFDEKLRLSANLQGPPGPPDLGFFHPDVPESYGTGDVIFNSKETIYREVYTFIKRVEDYALLVGEEKVAENLSTCLRGNALNWYLQELDDFTRRAL
ncbi:MAG: hypothetical protein FRX48_02174 [Lasallia pustulata]|uniref:Integrase catalytic domain-containing protein n=1 Tax=Lasallia pustulata TaxID=136370 RepID=A0A5M8PXY1_9LECA|nr:MAG: hypothetical protein FRX48_02174 [Lasallia pustulata]